MPKDPVRHRPKIYPPPEFPPRKAALFARTPPAVFPVILGMLGLGLALRRGLEAAGLPVGAADLVLGMAVPLWAFAVLAYGAKVLRRPGVVAEDLRVLPGRAGLAAAGMGGMAVAAALAPYAPGLAFGVLSAAFVAHGAVAILLIGVLRALPVETRGVTPAHHLAFVGFIVGGIAAALLGRTGLALFLIWTTLPVAAVIWGISAAQLVARIPPAPLRPMLAIHLAPAAVLASVAALTGHGILAQALMVLATAILLVLLACGRWIAEAGFTPMWGSFTFPLAAYAGACLAVGGAWEVPGMVVLAVAIGVVPAIAFRVLRLWPQGTLAARTNAAEA